MGGVCTGNGLPAYRLLKLWKVRSRLSRSRFLQVNTRVKALDEIYKIYRRLHRSDLQISAKQSSEFFQDLQDLQIVAPLRRQNFSKKSRPKFSNVIFIFQNFAFSRMFLQQCLSFLISTWIKFGRNFAPLLRKYKTNRYK